MAKSNTIMAIFQFDKDTRQLFETIVQPLVETHTGLKYEDGASYYEPSTVKMDLIHKMIEKAKLIIVDITHKNPNVFIELGIAYCLDKPMVLLCSRKSWESRSTKSWRKKAPFDIEGRELLIFDDENDLKVKLGRFISDSLHKTREITVGWNSKSKDNHMKSATEIEIFERGEIWSDSAVYPNFVMSCHVTIHELRNLTRNPDVRFYISAAASGFPRILAIFPWEISEIDQDKYECHIDYFPTSNHSDHERLQQVAVGPKDLTLIKDFDVSISFCWPNMVFESSFFENKVNRLYVTLSEFRSKGYPLHLAQFVGFEALHSRVSIRNIRIKEVFL